VRRHNVTVFVIILIRIISSLYRSITF